MFFPPESIVKISPIDKAIILNFILITLLMALFYIDFDFITNV